MRGKVSRWGNSLAIRIPKAVADEAGIAEDDPVDVRARDSQIILEPLRRRARGPLSLDELLDEIAEGNEDEEVEWGPPAGREEW